MLASGVSSVRLNVNVNSLPLPVVLALSVPSCGSPEAPTVEVEPPEAIGMALRRA